MKCIDNVNDLSAFQEDLLCVVSYEMSFQMFYQILEIKTLNTLLHCMVFWHKEFYL